MGCRGLLKVAAARRLCVSGLCLVFASASASAIPGVCPFSGRVPLAALKAGLLLPLSVQRLWLGGLR